MIRLLANEGGRPLKNEDLQFYIQAFNLLENLYSTLDHGNFILYGCELTDNLDTTYEITAGVIYYNGSLRIFDGASGVTLPYNLTSSNVDINNRTYESSSVLPTATEYKMIYDELGDFSITLTTARATDKFLRTVGSYITAPISMNNNELTNIWKPVLSDRAEMLREIPIPGGNGYYCKVGSFPLISRTEINLLFSGISQYNRSLVNLNCAYAGGTSFNSYATFLGSYYSDQNYDNLPSFYMYKNDGNSTMDIYVASNELLSIQSVKVQLVSLNYSATDNDFTFEETFSWGTSLPSGSLEATYQILSSREYVDAKETNLQNQITTNANNISTNATNISNNDTDISNLQSAVSTNTGNISTNATNISNNDTDISNLQGDVSTLQSDVSTLQNQGTIVYAAYVSSDATTVTANVNNAVSSITLDGNVYVISPSPGITETNFYTYYHVDAMAYQSTLRAPTVYYENGNIKLRFYGSDGSGHTVAHRVKITKWS